MGAGGKGGHKPKNGGAAERGDKRNKLTSLRAGRPGPGGERFFSSKNEPRMVYRRARRMKNAHERRIDGRMIFDAKL